jgi:hypothetical protein
MAGSVYSPAAKRTINALRSDGAKLRLDHAIAMGRFA